MTPQRQGLPRSIAPKRQGLPRSIAARLPWYAHGTRHTCSPHSHFRAGTSFLNEVKNLLRTQGCFLLKQPLSARPILHFVQE